MRLMFAVFVVLYAILEAESRVAVRSTQKALTEASSVNPLRVTRNAAKLPTTVIKTIPNKLANVPGARTQRAPTITAYPQRDLTSYFAELSRKKANRSSTIESKIHPANLITSTVPIIETPDKSPYVQEKKTQYPVFFSAETSTLNQGRISRGIFKDPLSLFNPINGGTDVEGTRAQRHLQQPGKPAPTRPAQVRTTKSTTTSYPKSNKVDVKKPIPKFNEVDYDEDFQAKMMKNPSRESHDDDDGNEDEDFNLDDYDFDFNHDEFSGRGKPSQPRLPEEKKKGKCEKCSKTTAQPSVKNNKNVTKNATLEKQNNYAFVLSKSDLSELNTLQVKKYVREAGSQESEEDDESDDDDSGGDAPVRKKRSSHSHGHNMRPKFTLTPLSTKAQFKAQGDDDISFVNFEDVDV